MRGDAPREYKAYHEAVIDLIGSIGEFCSYCEKPLKNGAEVEHVLPKSYYPELETDWSNFLLACQSCNRLKSNAVVSLEDACFPDKDNTFYAFLYAKSGMVKINPLLSEEQQQLAVTTMELVKLDRYPGFKEPSSKDRRYLQRFNAWNKAIDAKTRLEKNYSEELEDTVVDLVRSTGFWSVWMTVFDDDAHMRQRFIDAIQGTHKDSFDADTQPLPRGKI